MYYTICPDCGSELGFDLPADRSELPVGYDHVIKCPCCGKTLSVKVNPEAKAAPQQTAKPAPAVAAKQPVEQPVQQEEKPAEQPVANAAEDEVTDLTDEHVIDLTEEVSPAEQTAQADEQSEQTEQTGQVAAEETKDASEQAGSSAESEDDHVFDLIDKLAHDETAAPAASAPADESSAEFKPAKPAKKSGKGRNVAMLIVSLAFVALTIIGAVTKDLGANLYGGILMFGQLSDKAALVSAAGIVRYVLPFVLFVLAIVQAVVAIIALGKKTYCRSYNVISCAVIAAIALVMLLYPVEAATVGANVQALFAAKSYFALIGVIIGLIGLVLSLIFVKPLSKKEA